MSDRRSIVLTGFMGTGKSTVALLLADRLDRLVVDMDTLIEQRTGWPIARIFAERGEPFFRTLEHALCLELSLRDELVIATGGGALLNPMSREALVGSAFVVCLQARPETLTERLADSPERPLAGRWQALLAERQAVYDALPHQVWTDHKSPSEVVEEIIRLWNASQ
ncbi:MAG: shikimate kinase [Anaerolineae bacterium]|jgi:shikimate kinase